MALESGIVNAGGQREAVFNHPFLTSGYNDHPGPDNQQFQYQRDQRRKMQRQNRRDRKAVIGQSDINVDGFKGGQKFTDLFVSKIHIESSEDSFKNYLTSREVEVKEVEKLSHPDAYTLSFRIRIHTTDIDKILTSEDAAKFWPKGVHCRRFVRPRQHPGSFGNREVRNHNDGDD